MNKKLSDYAGIRVIGQNLMPFAYNGQTIIVSKSATLKNGDFVYVRFKNKLDTIMQYCEDKAKKVRSLLPVGILDKTSPINLYRKTYLFMWRVMSVETHYS